MMYHEMSRNSQRNNAAQRQTPSEVRDLRAGALAGDCKREFTMIASTDASPWLKYHHQDVFRAALLYA